MSKPYSSPRLVEYGRMGELTLGQTGTIADDVIINGQRININTICDPTQPHTGLICS